VREMDKYLAESKYIISKDFHNLNEKYKYLAQNQLKNEMTAKRVNPVFKSTVERNNRKYF
jgi:hypothetical protein